MKVNVENSSKSDKRVQFCQLRVGDMFVYENVAYNKKREAEQHGGLDLAAERFSDKQPSYFAKDTLVYVVDSVTVHYTE